MSEAQIQVHLVTRDVLRRLQLLFSDHSSAVGATDIRGRHPTIRGRHPAGEGGIEPMGEGARNWPTRSPVSVLRPGRVDKCRALSNRCMRPLAGVRLPQVARLL